LVRQLLSESLSLALTAGALGVVLAIWLQDLFLGFTPLERLGIDDLRISPTMLFFALGISIGTAVLFGILPSIATSKANPAADLKDAGHRTTRGRSGRLRSGLVLLQIAASLVVLMASGLIIRSYSRLIAVDPGFQTENLLLGGVSLATSDFPGEGERIQFFSQLQESVAALPGVESVSMASHIPIRDPGSDWRLWDPEQPPIPGERSPLLAFWRVITPGYFETLGIPLATGRMFETTDTDGSPRVIILSQSMAAALFPDENALGRQVAVDLGRDEPALFEVVGIVADHRLNSLAFEMPTAIFLPYASCHDSRLT
jgi:hypothetical protein